MCGVWFILNVILLFVNGTVAIMSYTLIKMDIMDALVSNFSSFIGNIENFLYSTNDEQIIVVTFVALVLVSIFFVFVFAVTKLISVFGKKTHRKWEIERNEEKEQHDEEYNNNFAEDFSAENEDNKELINSMEPHILNSHIEKEDLSDKKLNNEKMIIPLDWEKKRKDFTKQPNESKQNQINLRKNIHDLLHIIVNMIGRNIDELKIAQTLMFYKKDDWSEESILQLVHSIKEFIKLCNQHAFDNLRKEQNLPSDEDCILHLIAGDASYAMAVLEALIDNKINMAVKTKNAEQQLEMFKQTSYYACYFGSLAEISDIKLASASFELAVEMYPQNTLAWSRCADLYKTMGMEDKANQAYYNVLKIADFERDRAQTANACKVLSQYLYANGEGDQALQLYTQSKSFYDSIGINRPLDKKEVEIIELIEKSNSEIIVDSVLYNNQNSHLQ